MIRNTLILAILSLSVLLSCDSAYHLQKAIDKGATFTKDTVTVKVHDTIQGVDGKDSIIIRDIVVPCPEVEVPKTRWMVRFDNNRFKDSLKHIRKALNDSTDNSFKVLKEENNMLEDSLIQFRKMKKNDNHTDVKLNRCNWWIRLMGRIWWIPAIIAFAGGLIIRGYWSNITAMFKKRLP